jgi:hypothetical protein
LQVAAGSTKKDSEDTNNGKNEHRTGSAGTGSTELQELSLLLVATCFSNVSHEISASSKTANVPVWPLRGLPQIVLVGI